MVAWTPTFSLSCCTPWVEQPLGLWVSGAGCGFSAGHGQHWGSASTPAHHGPQTLGGQALESPGVSPGRSLGLQRSQEVSVRNVHGQ